MIVSTPDVQTEPEVEVFNWKIVKLIDKEGNVSEHVTGHEYWDYARVSTAIVEKGEGYALTTSGRKYILIGKEQRFVTRTAAYVLEGFKRINELEGVKDEVSGH
ncbi:hypothetical protein D3C85_293100 [compost metagenome]